MNDMDFNLKLVRVLVAFAASFMAIRGAADEIKATGCFLILKDQAQVPARERGLLRKILVDPGDQVEVSQVLASLEDNQARLALRLAEIDLNVAEKRSTDAVAVEIAEATVEESAKAIEQARLDEQISVRMAESDLPIRQAVAARELAKDAFDRAVESREQFRSSVSSREMATLEYQLEKHLMDEEQARYDQSLQLLRSRSQSVLVHQREIAWQRLQLQLSQERLEHGIASLTVRRMVTSADVAKENLERHQIRSPLTGLVVERLRYAGEWVEAGDPVLRVVRLDSLFTEGYVASNLVDRSFRGHEVTVTGDTRQGPVRVTGKIVFVSPETDPVNGQVQVRAEIDNTNLRLRPGQRVGMVIHTE